MGLCPNCQISRLACETKRRIWWVQWVRRWYKHNESSRTKLDVL